MTTILASCDVPLLRAPCCVCGALAVALASLPQELKAAEEKAEQRLAAFKEEQRQYAGIREQVQALQAQVARMQEHPEQRET